MESAPLSVLFFYLMAAITVIGACGVAFSNHIVYSALALMVSFLGVAGLYVMLDAEFVAGVQVLVYVGGVLVLTLFAVMLTHGIQDIRVSNRTVGRWPGVVLVGAAFAVIARAMIGASWNSNELVPEHGSPQGIGNALLGEFILPFEVASLVLLVVLVGAVVLTRKEVVE